MLSFMNHQGTIHEELAVNQTSPAGYSQVEVVPISKCVLAGILSNNRMSSYGIQYELPEESFSGYFQKNKAVSLS